MKRQLVLLSGALALMAAGPAHSDEPTPEILASRGEGVVTQEQFNARAARIPDYDRESVLRDRRRLQDLLNAMLLSAQLSAAARAAGYDQDPGVQARMQLAADEELGRAWLQHYADTTQAGDYEQMAREQYTLNPGRYRTPETLDLTHILIGTEHRTEPEALEIATQLRERLAADPTQFEALVNEYSDDPSKASNHGHFSKVKPGDMVKPFENAAFSMEKGQISEPVKTKFGYHIIRVEDIHPPVQKSFEEVQVMLTDRQRRKHVEQVRNDYLSELSALNVEIPEGALEEMVRRQFGEDAVADSGDDTSNE